MGLLRGMERRLGLVIEVSLGQATEIWTVFGQAIELPRQVELSFKADE